VNVLDEQTAQLKEQVAQIQKVNAELELSKSEPQIILNNGYSSQPGSASPNEQSGLLTLIAATVNGCARR